MPLSVSNILWMDLSEYVEFNGDVNFFPFWPKIPFLGKFSSKV